MRKHFALDLDEGWLEPDSTDKPVSYLSPKQLSTPINHILLTGSTGKIGGYLLKDLIETTDTKITCLVRGATDEQTQEKVLHNLAVYGNIDKWREKLAEGRIRVINADLEKINLGLSDEVYKQLIDGIDCVIHAAAVTSLRGSYEKLYPINVLATQLVIDFALQTKSKYMTYISSYSIFGEKIFIDREPITEDEFDIGQKFHKLGYQKTKFEAEALINKAKKKGLKGLILRLGNIMGDSETGAFKIDKSLMTDFFYGFTVILIKERVFPLFMQYFNVCPVDYCAKSVNYLIVTKRYYDTNFHILNPHQPRMIEVGYELKKVAAELGFSIDLLSPNDYIKFLDKNGRVDRMERLFLAQIESYAQYLLSRGGCQVGCQYTQFFLTDSGITCEKVSEKLLMKYILKVREMLQMS